MTTKKFLVRASSLSQTQIAGALTLVVITGGLSGCKIDVTGTTGQTTTITVAPSPVPSVGIIQPSPTPIPLPSITPIPSATPTVTPSPTPTATPSPSPSPVDPTPLAYTVIPPTHGASLYGTHEAGKRTFNFTTNATAVACSHDGGTTYGACDSPTSIAFTAADYAGGATIKIKFSKTGQADQVYSAQPSALFPGLTFLTCTRTVTSNMTFAAFDAFLSTSATAGDVICLDPGVSVTNPSGTKRSLTPTKNNLTVIGAESNPATILNSNASGTLASDTSAFTLGGAASVTGFRLAHLTLRTGGALGHGVHLDSAGDSAQLSYVDLATYGSGAVGVLVAGGSVGIDSSLIATSGAGASHALSVTQSGANVVVTESVIDALGPSAHAMAIGAPATVSLNNADLSVSTAASTGNALFANPSGGTLTLTAMGATFTSLATGSKDAVALQPGSGGLVNATFKGAFFESHTSDSSYAALRITPAPAAATSVSVLTSDFYASSSAIGIDGAMSLTLDDTSFVHLAEGVASAPVIRNASGAVSTASPSAGANFACNDSASFVFSGWGSSGTGNFVGASPIGACD